jgi:AraC-like DNA-binding protein
MSNLGPACPGLFSSENNGALRLPRYLQRLLESMGTSFTAHVNQLRLQRAFTLLIEARDGKGRISDVALQAGFSDISHFNRLFRSRFGDTPSGVRARGGQSER